MEKQDLINLKKKISELSDREKQLRDKHLQRMAYGEIQGPLTGYPSIDKPWLEYVDLDKQHKKKESKTIYEEIRDNNKNRLNNVALEFFGTKIKYKKLFKKIDEFAKAFVANGVKKGDYVTICCAGIPETVYSLYALAKIGAVANFMAPFFDKTQMAERIKDCDSKLLLVMDSFYEKIKPAIDESSIEKIVVMPTLNSSVVKYIKKSPKITGKNIIQINEFVEEGKNIESTPTVEYEKDMPFILVYSSGSTGASKAILLSHDSFQNSIHSYECCGIDLNSNQKFYQIIPPWFSTGSSTSIHLPLANGAMVFMDPRFERKTFVSNIIKHKINTTVAPTTLYEGFLDKKNIKKNALSNFTNPFQGGEPLKKETKESIEKVFAEHGSKSALKIGYGQCECGAGIATQTDDFYRSDGSVGIPIPGVVCSIFDDEKNELSYNQRGEILVVTQSGMVEYYKKTEATKEYFYIDESGTKWSCTGDIGYIDEKGNLFVQGRKSDFSIVNGKKIYNFDIENIIITDDAVKNIDIMSTNGHGDTLVAHIIFEEKYLAQIKGNEEVIEEKIRKIQQQIFDTFGDIAFVPEVFKIRKEFPIAPSGKRDLSLLKSEKEGFIRLDKNSIINSEYKLVK